jgi:hypothetical protein
LCLLAIAPRAVGETPAGEYTIEAGDDARVTLAEGSAEVCETDDAGEVCTAATSYTAIWDRLDGGGSITLTGPVHGVLAFSYYGRMGGTTREPRVRLTLVHARGELSDGSEALDVEGWGRARCELDPADAARFACKTKMRLCAVIDERPFDCSKISFPLALAAVRPPPFQVILRLQTDDANRLSGTADIRVEAAEPGWLGDPGRIDFEVRKGRYQPESDSSKLSFRLAHGGDSNKLAIKQLVLEGQTATSGEIKFNIAGQKGRSSVGSAP